MRPPGGPDAGAGLWRQTLAHGHGFRNAGPPGFEPPPANEFVDGVGKESTVAGAPLGLVTQRFIDDLLGMGLAAKNGVHSLEDGREHGSVKFW